MVLALEGSELVSVFSRSDGVVGIARAFLAAGAAVVVVSLWPVDDEATLELMWRFYHYRMHCGGNADLAMRHAMRSMIDEKSFSGWSAKFSVLDWAGFVVYGSSGGNDGGGGTVDEGDSSASSAAEADHVD